MERLYIVTRRDLPEPVQAVQSGHAISAFAVKYPELHAAWHNGGRNLIYLAAENETALKRILWAGAEATATFNEPDLNDELTAIALSGEVRKRLSSLPKSLWRPRPDDGKCHECR